MIYFDNCRTTVVPKEVIEAMMPYFSEKYGVSSGLYSLAMEANDALEKVQKIISKSINAKQNEIVFTSGATEANNLAIKGVAYANKDIGNHIITTRIEHPSVLDVCKELEKQGFKVDYLDVDSKGFVDLNQLKKLITDKTILVSVMHVNHVIGTIEPIEEIGKLLKKQNHKVYFHTDVAESYTKIPVDVEKMNVDLLSMSSHKVHGPKGVGALFIKEGTRIKPMFQGAESFSEIRPGSENVPGIVGFGKAVELAFEKFDEYRKHVIKLREKLIAGIEKNFPDAVLNGSRKNRSPYNANFSFKNVEGEALTLQLDMNGIAVATGSACVSRKLKANYVLLAIGLKPEDAHGSIRFCLSRYNTEEEIERTIKILKKVYENLLRISGVYGNKVY